ncbi:MAG: DUF481 domain-containing protein, partial [Planctomycetota bacterium]
MLNKAVQIDDANPFGALRMLAFVVMMSAGALGQSSTPSWKLGIPSFLSKRHAKAASESASSADPTLPSSAFATTGSVPGSMGSVPGSMGSVPGSMGSVPGSMGSVPGSMGSVPSFAVPSFEIPPADVAVQPVAYEGSGTPPPPVVDPDTTPLPPPAASPIGRAVEAGILPPSPPLQEETRAWYMVPLRWMRGWENHAEFGLDGSAGNAETLALQTGLETKRKTDQYTLSMDIDYRKASSRGVTTEDNGRFNLDYDRLLGDSPWAYFGKFGAEFDQFKAFDARINLNGGASYHWVRTDEALFVTRFGAGASREIGAPIDDWIPEGVFGLEAERQVNR